MPRKVLNSTPSASLKTSQISSSYISIPFSRCGGCTLPMKNCTCYGTPEVCPKCESYESDSEDETTDEEKEIFESKYRKELYCHNETKEELKGATEIINSYKKEIDQLKSDLFTSKIIVEARDNTIKTICEERSTLYDETQKLNERNIYLKVDNNETYKKYNDMKRHANNLDKLNGGLIDERDKFESENKTYQSKLFNLQSVLEERNNKLERLEKENAIMKRMISKRQKGLLIAQMQSDEKEVIEKMEKKKELIEKLENGTFFFPKKKELNI